MSGSAIVFGAGSGLGAALVQRFSKGGLKTVAVSRNREKLQALFASTPDVICIAADATDPAAVASSTGQLRPIAPEPAIPAIPD